MLVVYYQHEDLKGGQKLYVGVMGRKGERMKARDATRWCGIQSYVGEGVESRAVR